MDNYQSSAHCKYLLKYHMVFVTKYRKSILMGEFDTYIKTLLKRVSMQDDSLFSIDILETDKNHVHMMLNTKPTVSPSAIARRLKTITTAYAWQEWNNYLEKIYWGEHTLWSDGYFVCTTGDACIETVRQYIANQG